MINAKLLQLVVEASNDGIVVAEQEVHVAAGGARLLLQLEQQPEHFGHVPAAVEHVAIDDQVVSVGKVLTPSEIAALIQAR